MFIIVVSHKFFTTEYTEYKCSCSGLWVIHLPGIVLSTGTDQHRCSAQWACRLTEQTSSCRATTKRTAINKYSHSSKVLTLDVCQRHQPHQTNMTYTALLLTFIISSMVSQGCVYGEGKVVQPVSDGGFDAASYFTNPAASHSTGDHMLQSKCCWMVEIVSITPFRNGGLGPTI